MKEMPRKWAFNCLDEIFATICAVSIAITMSNECSSDPWAVLWDAEHLMYTLNFGRDTFSSWGMNVSIGHMVGGGENKLWRHKWSVGSVHAVPVDKSVIRKYTVWNYDYSSTVWPLICKMVISYFCGETSWQERAQLSRCNVWKQLTNCVRGA